VLRLSALRAGRLYLQDIFLLEAESTSGPQCGLKDYVNDTIGNRTRDLPAGIAVLQPTATVVIFWIALPYILVDRKRCLHEGKRFLRNVAPTALLS
jgi:hypothetical protein